MVEYIDPHVLVVSSTRQHSINLQVCIYIVFTQTRISFNLSAFFRTLLPSQPFNCNHKRNVMTMHDCNLKSDASYQSSGEIVAKYLHIIINIHDRYFYCVYSFTFT